MTPGNLVREGHILAHDGAVTELALTTPCQACQNPCLLGSTARRRIEFATPGGAQLRVGERVHITVSRSELTRTCAVLFGVPLLAWVCGGVLGSYFWGESGAVLLALLLLTGALLGIRANRWSLRRWVKLELIALHGNSDVEQTLSAVDL